MATSMFLIRSSVALRTSVALLKPSPAHPTSSSIQHRQDWSAAAVPGLPANCTPASEVAPPILRFCSISRVNRSIRTCLQRFGVIIRCMSPTRLTVNSSPQCAVAPSILWAQSPAVAHRLFCRPVGRLSVSQPQQLPWVPEPQGLLLARRLEHKSPVQVLLKSLSRHPAQLLPVLNIRTARTLPLAVPPRPIPIIQRFLLPFTTTLRERIVR